MGKSTPRHMFRMSGSCLSRTLPSLMGAKRADVQLSQTKTNAAPLCSVGFYAASCLATVGGLGLWFQTLTSFTSEKGKLTAPPQLSSKRIQKGREYRNRWAMVLGLLEGLLVDVNRVAGGLTLPLVMGLTSLLYLLYTYPLSPAPTRIRTRNSRSQGRV